MGLFRFLNRSSDTHTTMQSTVSKSVAVQSNPLMSIHDDLKGLIWIGDGPHKNYKPDNTARNSIDIGGVRISLSLMGSDEPSLIHTRQQISIPEDKSSVERPSYYPTYDQLSPEQKGVYLSLLQNPYDATFDIGFVFILYYGLERHLLRGNFEAAYHVVLKLRDVHPNRSFQSYSANALVLTSMLHQRGELALEFVNSLDKEFELSFSDNLFLLCYYSFQIPLKAKDLMRMAKTFEFTNTNYIRKYPALFEECLRNVVMDKLGTETVRIEEYLTSTELKKLHTRDVRIFANTSIIDKTYPVPMLSENFKLKKEMNTMLDTAHQMVKRKTAEMRRAGVKLPTNKAKVSKAVRVFDDKQERTLLAQLEGNRTNLVSRHFSYICLQDFYYKYREVDVVYLQKCIEYCLLDIESLPEMKNEYVKQEIASFRKLAAYGLGEDAERQIAEVKRVGFVGRIPAFKRLAIIYEKQGEYEQAMDVCEKALSFGESHVEFSGRKEKIVARMNKKEPKVV